MNLVWRVFTAPHKVRSFTAKSLEFAKLIAQRDAISSFLE